MAAIEPPTWIRLFPLTILVTISKLAVWAICVAHYLFLNSHPGGSLATTFIKKDDVHRAWHVVDAKGQVLGRLASRIASVLTGKDKPEYAPFLDTGDHIIVINAEKIILTGNKEEDKAYFRHTGYPGGIRETRAGKVRDTHPERLIESAVRGMLPKNKLGRAQFKKLKVYKGSQHPHEAQKPAPLVLKTRVPR